MVFISSIFRIIFVFSNFDLILVNNSFLYNNNSVFTIGLSVFMIIIFQVIFIDIRYGAISIFFFSLNRKIISFQIIDLVILSFLPLLLIDRNNKSFKEIKFVLFIIFLKNYYKFSFNFIFILFKIRYSFINSSSNKFFKFFS